MCWLLWLEGSQATSLLSESAAPAHLSAAAAATFQDGFDSIHIKAVHTLVLRADLKLAFLDVHESER